MYDELKKAIEESGKIVFFGGAGVSTESGIPDFRSADGLYNAKNNYGRSPEEMISIDFFEYDTETFFDYYKKNLIATWAKPNKAHYALARLEEQGKLIGVATQNIDGLHQLAGSKKVYELHGSVQRNTCRKCHAHYNLDFIMDEKNCRNGVPICPVCGGVIKPDVVLYGEMLDDETVRGAVDAIRSADMLIIGGTSLVVYPAAGFVNYYKGNKLVLINKSETAMDGRANIVIHDSIGEVLSKVVE